MQSVTTKSVRLDYHSNKSTSSAPYLLHSALYQNNNTTAKTNTKAGGTFYSSKNNLNNVYCHQKRMNFIPIVLQQTSTQLDEEIQQRQQQVIPIICCNLYHYHHNNIWKTFLNGSTGYLYDDIVSLTRHSNITKSYNNPLIVNNPTTATTTDEGEVALKIDGEGFIVVPDTQRRIIRQKNENYLL